MSDPHDPGERAGAKRRVPREDAFNTAARMLGRRPLSLRGLIDKLCEKGFDPEEARDAGRRMLELGYLNDMDYARMLMRHYGGRGYGPGRLRDEFYRRGIDRETGEAVLEEWPGAGEELDRLVQNALRSGPLDESGRRRLTNRLQRRGFDWQDIAAALRRAEG